MGRSPCCEKVGLKKGPWTPEEDQKLLAYIEEHGHGSWRALPAKAGLQRCGKSCRLRWTNYLRPDIKRGKFSLQEEQTIIQLHALLGNRWSAIATHLAKRTDNEIKNYWNTHLKKRLTKMGIDPATHKPKTDTLGSSSGNPKDAANLSHMAQWESARLEAEARLVRESKLTNNNNNNNNKNRLGSVGSTPTPHFKSSTGLPCLDILKAWQGSWSTKSNTYNNNNNNNALLCMLAMDDLESPTSTLNFPDHHSSTTTANLSSVQTIVPFEEKDDDNVSFHDILSAFGCTDTSTTHNAWFLDGSLIKNNIINNNNNVLVDNVTSANNNNTTTTMPNIMENVTDVFVYTSEDHNNNEEINGDEMFGVPENKSYWNSILNLVNANSPAGSTVF